MATERFIAPRLAGAVGYRCLLRVIAALPRLLQPALLRDELELPRFNVVVNLELETRYWAERSNNYKGRPHA